MDQMNTQNTGSTASNIPQNLRIDDKAIKKVTGEALSTVPGVLGVEGGLLDMLKSDDDMTKGISVWSVEGDKVHLGVKIITEYGQNIPDVVNAATAKVTGALQSLAGLTPNPLEIEVVDTMTREDYAQKNGGSSAS